MIKTVCYYKTNITYELIYKKVKNINLRIRPDGKICVSVNRRVPQKMVNDFVLSKAEFILNALEKHKNKPEKKQYFAESVIRDVIFDICAKVYPYFEKKGIMYPEIKFRKMVSQWGNCRAERGILTFNINLMYVPHECIEYVVFHEFTHFIQQNHSKSFYEELAKVCPDWKRRRAKLKEISVK